MSCGCGFRRYGDIFCRVGERPRELKGDFGVALDNVNQRLESFQVETESSGGPKLALLQSQAFENARADGGNLSVEYANGKWKNLGEC